MKKWTCIILLALGLVAFASLPNRTAAASESGTVTSAASGAFASGAVLNSVVLSSLDLGTGVFIEADGTASGVFNAVLAGHSVLGVPQQITVDGNVKRGAIAPDGRAYLSGLATVNFGNGMPALSGVPFSATTTASSLVLAIGATTLPAAHLTEGTVSIQ